MTSVITGPAVGDSVRELLSNSRGRKRVAVAYIGDDPVELLGGKRAVRGAIVYCWPQPGATNPYGVDELVTAGAEVVLVNQLHAKIYWTSDNGALVGSANISGGGLSKSGNIEAMVWVASNSVPASVWDKLTKLRLRGNEERRALVELRKAWNLRRAAKGERLKPRRARTPKEWVDEKGREEIWVVCSHTCMSDEEVRGVEETIRTERFVSELTDCFTCSVRIPEGVWVLSLFWGPQDEIEIEWMFIDGAVKLTGDFKSGSYGYYQKGKRNDVPLRISAMKITELKQKLQAFGKNKFSAAFKLSPRFLRVFGWV